MESYKNQLENRLKESIDAFNKATMPFIDSLDGVLDDMIDKAGDEISKDDVKKIKTMMDNPDIKDVLNILNTKFKK